MDVYVEVYDAKTVAQKIEGLSYHGVRVFRDLASPMVIFYYSGSLSNSEVLDRIKSESDLKEFAIFTDNDAFMIGKTENLQAATRHWNKLLLNLEHIL